MSWASLLKLGTKAAKWIGKGAAATVETTGKAVLHPQQTLKGAGTALKTATVGGALGYVGWQKLTTDDSVVGIVSDALIGKENTEAIGNTIQETKEDIRDLKDSVSNMSNTVSSTMGNVDNKMNGISEFIGGVTFGNTGNMLGNFADNLLQGKVSGLGIMGLVLSSFLLFGRFGWMGKIAGAVLAMMMIGNNSQKTNEIKQPQTNVQTKTAEQTIQPVAEAEQIHRSRR